MGGRIYFILSKIQEKQINFLKVYSQHSVTCLLACPGELTEDNFLLGFRDFQNELQTEKKAISEEIMAFTV